jgi:large subunit ribosomal protein L2
LPIEEIPVGSYIHNVAPTTSKEAQISRAAGTFTFEEKTTTHAKMSSGEQRFISPKCYATIGIVSNEYFSYLV